METNTVQRRERGRKFIVKPKVCMFCADKTPIDYKNVSLLQRFVSDRGKIVPRRRTGVCARHQRSLAQAIKRSRFLAMLPSSPNHVYNISAAERKA
ncbi:MAG: 30S ribosomal protein S18 [Dehalococcoidia bacterium]|nr:30S ribosomal protein S18 [Dehalococcoidia bacterium]MDD5648287.1 30S ribosomal protein S18 [Dehalococcoidia bacterium]